MCKKVYAKEKKKNSSYVVTYYLRSVGCEHNKLDTVLYCAGMIKKV